MYYSFTFSKQLHATPAVSVYSSLDSSATTGATESLRVSLPVPGYHSDVDSQSDHSEADMLSGVYPLRDTASEGSVDDCEVNYVEMQQEAKDAEGSDVAVKQMADSDATLVEEVSEAQNPKKEKVWNFYKHCRQLVFYGGSHLYYIFLSH